MPEDRRQIRTWLRSMPEQRDCVLQPGLRPAPLCRIRVKQTKPDVGVAKFDVGCMRRLRLTHRFLFQCDLAHKLMLIGTRIACSTTHEWSGLVDTPQRPLTWSTV